MGVLAIIVIGFVGIAIDLGLIAKKKAELVRAVDAAALAGALLLPDQAAAQDEVALYMGEVQPDASILGTGFPEQNQIEVRASAPQDLTFIKVLNLMPGIDITNPAVVTAEAVAGFGVLPLDVVLNMDSTGSMGFSPCNSSRSNPGCPIKESIDAAVLFSDILLTGSVEATETQIGLVPYNYCFNPPRLHSSCVDSNLIVDLTTDKDLLQSRIRDLEARGNTNVCLGLLRGGEVLLDSPKSNEAENASRIVVLLSDGDNWWRGTGFGNGQPPAACRPINPGQGDGAGPCGSRTTRQEADLDEKTFDVAVGLKDQGVEIFVVGFGVCGDPTIDVCDENIIGDRIPDSRADRNLLKCVASSSEHYFEVERASDLPGVFENIARRLAFRLVQ